MCLLRFQRLIILQSLVVLLFSALSFLIAWVERPPGQFDLIYSTTIMAIKPNSPAEWQDFTFGQGKIYLSSPPVSNRPPPHLWVCGKKVAWYSDLNSLGVLGPQPFLICLGGCKSYNIKLCNTIILKLLNVTICIIP